MSKGFAVTKMQDNYTTKCVDKEILTVKLLAELPPTNWKHVGNGVHVGETGYGTLAHIVYYARPIA